MARERYVTRTVEVSVCEVMCMDITTAEVVIRYYDVGGGITDRNALLKAIKREHETDNFKCVAITHVETRETLYGMPEADFIRLARVLPPRTTTKAQED